ncbi:MAG: type II secretion system ATPase GspE [bacterium]
MAKGYKAYQQIGSLLIKEGLITEQQLQQALDHQKSTKERLGNILVDLKIVSQRDIFKVLGRQLNIDYITAEQMLNIDPALLETIPSHVAKVYHAIPFAKEGKKLIVVVADPFDLFTIDDLKSITDHEIYPAIGAKEDIEEAINKLYGGDKIDALQDIMERLGSGEGIEKINEEEINLEELKNQISDAPVVKLVDYIITNAVNKRASDIHVEPMEKTVSIRYRIDGILYEIFSPPKHLQMAIISRIKILANLDIAERRLPQDGRFTAKAGNKLFDLRISTLPTVFGEKVVLRLLEKSGFSTKLEELGMEADDLEKFKRKIKRPNGMILLTGPTGSGKSTTLYAALNYVKSSETNIVTVEDPVEYQLNGINQVQAHPKIGLTFAHVLRSILRQDPDIIMVGEVRDLETAEMAIKSSLTGHLVFSTLHTNDAVATIIRLTDMGVEPFLVCSSLTLAIAQRLVRRLCPDCKEPYEPSPEELERLRIRNPTGKKITFYRPQGCPKCSNTGYFGRIAIHELLDVNQEIKNMVLRNALPDIIKRRAVELGMSTLFQSGLKKVIRGITTLEEILGTAIDE